MKEIVITGGDGYIAKSIIKALGNEYHFHILTHDIVDLADPFQSSFLCGLRGDVLIHTACVGGSRLKKDDYTVTRDIIAMYYNLAPYFSQFRKVISFGSGAELAEPFSSYGLGKRIVADDIKKRRNAYNLRVFAVFDENELPTRFIKANLTHYINNESMKIHENKYMDFFYMKDLINLVKYYIETEDPPKEIDCVYEKAYNLLGIAMMINSLNQYLVPILYNSSVHDLRYVGKHTQLPINYIGLEQGIRETYDNLLHSNSKK